MRCIIFKNQASQKLTVMAFADAGHASLDAGEPVTSDAAQITCKVEQDDDGTRTAIVDTNPTETEDGQYVFDLTASECNGDKLTFYPESSTAGVQVVCLPSNVIYTRPPNFPELGIESDGDLTKVNELNGHTAQTGDSYARIGAAGASLTAIPWNASWDAEVQSEVEDGLTAYGASTLTAAQVNAQVDQSIEDYHLDHLLAATYDPTSKPGASDALLNELIENDGGVSRYTANALEQAPSGGGGGGDATAANQTTIINAIATAQADLDIVTGADGTTLATSQPNYAPNTTTPPTATAIRDAILDRVLSGNHDTAGTPGELFQTVDMLVDALFHGWGTISSITDANTFVLTGANIPATSAAVKGTQMVVIRHDNAAVRQTRRVTDWDDNTGTVTLESEASIAQVGNYVFFLSQYSVSGTDVDNQIVRLDPDGRMGINWDDIGTPTATVNLSGTTVKAVTDQVTADTTALNGSTNAAAQLARSAATIVNGTAAAGTLSTTQMTTDLSEATDDHYNGRIILWTSGALQNQATDVTDYSGSNGLLTFTATTEAPQAGDTFILV